MAAPILTETHIEEVSQTIRSKQLGINKIEIGYKKGTVYIETAGIEGIPQADTYYENIEDHLVFSDLSWLGPICHQLNVNLDATIAVDPEGEFEHNSIKIGMLTTFPGEMNSPQILRKLTPLLTRLVPFRNYLTRVEFVWHGGSLSSIRFSMDLDGKKVNTILSNASVPNNQILRQWASTIDHTIDSNKGRYKHRITLPIVNGRMNTATYETGVCFKFDAKGKKL
ncbi:hypothetical protein [Robertmurraya sp. FSL R5-0851]|uniref:hypothetical protein n=1 Tax=Robertmurraya sp. FSL R5-0851 TaxID=2921584 RepID=UPI0030F9F24A